MLTEPGSRMKPTTANSQKSYCSEYENYRSSKRVKTSETSEKDVERQEFESQGKKPCSEQIVQQAPECNKNDEEIEYPFRRLSFSNFEPIQPKDME